MRVLVTGAEGFVGRHLLPRLVDAGLEVTGTDRDVDVTDRAAVLEAVRRVRPQGVVHLAAQSSVAASWKDPLSAYRLNYLGSLAVLSAVESEAPDARLLLIGSSDSYGSDAGRGGRPIAETEPLRPESPYARSKAAAELLGALACRRGLDVVRIRAFSHIGPGQSDRFVASSFARQVAEVEAGLREPRLVVGNLASVRDLLDVRDVTDAYRRLLDPAVPAATYNVASGLGVPVQRILDQLLELAGLDVEVVVDPERFRPTDYRIGDASRLRKATGWAPRISLRDTLSALLDWWRGRIGATPA